MIMIPVYLPLSTSYCPVYSYPSSTVLRPGGDKHHLHPYYDYSWGSQAPMPWDAATETIPYT